MRRLSFTLGTLALAAIPAFPRVMVVFRLASPPLLVEAGQQFALCAANVGATNTDLTHAVRQRSDRQGGCQQRRDAAAAAGAGGVMPDPCLVTSAEAISAAGSPPPGEPAMVVGLVIMKRGVFARAVAATAAIQVTALAPSGERHMVASVPLHVATMTNGRNTPIERVH